MKDRHTGRPRGFGFITYADPSVVDAVIQDVHAICGKEVEIKRTIPKGMGTPTEFKTKKIFVGGIPSTVTEDEFESFFSKYGKVVEHEIIRDHVSKRSRGFGFVVFDSERVVDDLLAGGNMIDLAGTKVEVKKAEPKKPSNPPPGPAYGNESRGRPYHEGYGGYGDYGYGSGGGGYGPGPYRSSMGGFGGGRFGDYGGYGPGGPDFGPGGYGGYGGGSGGYGGAGGYGGYRGDSPFGGGGGGSYSSRYGPYGGGGYGGTGGGGAMGGYGRGGGGGYGGYGGSGPAGGYDSGPGPSYGSGGGAGGPYGGGGRMGGGYGGSSRYHPYAR
ncbi:PREDICTED: heterogeneous nuclear ribonucleoproteins A2/B1-like isoform X2 [Tarenaya hassleriana]|nr:PREDICTED: heterogeneous nuclear ribonucleoproteins A2/B1-like isoform X2 [Tarenaya hassleriana]